MRTSSLFFVIVLKDSTVSHFAYKIDLHVSERWQVKQRVTQPGPKHKVMPMVSFVSSLCWHFSHCASHKLLSPDMKSLGCLFYPYCKVGSFRSSIWERLATTFMMETRPGGSSPKVQYTSKQLFLLRLYVTNHLFFHQIFIEHLICAKIRDLNRLFLFIIWVPNASSLPALWEWSWAF